MPKKQVKRQQLLERTEYDFNDKIDCMDKSNWKCSHCGTPLRLRDNATIDHFIPISKGGINQKINLVPLCENCNKNKRNKIVSPDWYLKYLDPKYRKEVEDYFESYVKSFEYLSRGNLMRCDMYDLMIYTGPPLRIKDKKKRQEMEKRVSKHFLLERVYSDEIEELEDFFTDYLEKRKQLDSRENVKKNLEFWESFGVIYVIRNRETRKIQVMVPVMIGKDYDSGIQINCMKMCIFSQYATDISCKLVAWMPNLLAQELVKEQNLAYIRVQVWMMRNDKASEVLIYENPDVEYANAWIIARSIYYGQGKVENKYDAEHEKFYERFLDIEKSMDQFFDRDGYREMRWMGQFILPDYAEETEGRVLSYNGGLDDIT